MSDTKAGLVRVLVVGGSGTQLASEPGHPTYEATDLDCIHVADDRNINEAIAYLRPQVIVSFGDVQSYKSLHALPFYIRQTWIHFDSEPEFYKAGEAALKAFILSSLRKRQDAPPLVSVITPAYRTGNKIKRPYNSLCAQTYPEWEWLLWDDSHDKDETWNGLRAIARDDHRVRLFKGHRHSGVIGEVKHNLGHLAQGEFIVELDHDDELTPEALSYVVQAFKEYPEAGFAYSNWAEVFEQGGNFVYGPGWALGYGKSFRENLNGREYVTNEAPHLNPKTLRHIVGMPNHLRAWRRQHYLQIGGHNPRIHVADDYELCVRSFLATRVVKIKKLAYIQYKNKASGNTSGDWLAEIQRLVRHIQGFYDRAIHNRLLELGVDDYCWHEPTKESCMGIPNPDVEPIASLEWPPNPNAVSPPAKLPELCKNIDGSVKKLLITHVWNDELYLRGWLRHHVPLFDHGVVILTPSTDSTEQIIKEEAPDWTVEKLDTEKLTTGPLEAQIHRIESRYPGWWKMVLTVTEYLLTSDLNPIIQNAPSPALWISGYGLVDSPEEKDLPYDPAVPVFKQRSFGFDMMRTFVYQRNQGRRLLHRYHDGHYFYGRHFTGHSDAVDFPSLKLVRAFYSPYNEAGLARKMSIQNNLSQEEAAAGRCGEHYWSLEKRQKDYADLLSKSHKLDFAPLLQPSTNKAQTTVAVAIMHKPRKGERQPLLSTLRSLREQQHDPIEMKIRVFAECSVVDLPEGVEADPYDPATSHPNPHVRAIAWAAQIGDPIVILEDDHLFCNNWLTRALALLNVATKGADKPPIVNLVDFMPYDELATACDSTNLKVAGVELWRFTERTSANSSGGMIMSVQTARQYAAFLPSVPHEKGWLFDAWPIWFCGQTKSAYMYNCNPCLLQHDHEAGSTWLPGRVGDDATTKRFQVEP